MVDWLRRTFPIRKWHFKGFVYQFDSLIFNAYIIGVVFFAVALISIYGLNTITNNWYLECPKDNYLGQCENPLYNNFRYCGKVLPYDSEFCSKEVLYNGEVIGTKPPFLITYFSSFVWVGLVIMFVINHFMYNKDFEFKRLGRVLSDEISNNNDKD